jgi:hypothetical protein
MSTKNLEKHRKMHVFFKQMGYSNSDMQAKYVRLTPYYYQRIFGERFWARVSKKPNKFGGR